MQSLITSIVVVVNSGQGEVCAARLLDARLFCRECNSASSSIGPTGDDIT